MSHIDEQRMTELGLEPELQPTKSETAHLRSCAACATALAREREFTHALRALHQPEVPAGFLVAVSERFVALSAAGRRRRLLVSVFGALGAGLVLAVPLVLWVVLNTGTLVRAAAGLIKSGAVAFDIGEALLSGLPAMGSLLVGGSAAAVILATVALNRLAGATVTSTK